MNAYCEDSMDSIASRCSSASSRISRKKKESACLYFISDGSTGITEDVRAILKSPRRCGDKYTIEWDGVMEQVCLIAAGTKKIEVKEARDTFEVLVGKRGISPGRAIRQINGEDPLGCSRSPIPRRRQRKTGSDLAPLSSLFPKGANEGESQLPVAIGEAIRGPDAWLPNEPRLEVPSCGVEDSNCITDPDCPASVVGSTDPSIDAELVNAADDMERGEILMRHARGYLRNGPTETSVLLHPGFDIYIPKTEKIAAVGRGSTPKKLQEELLLRLFGREYISTHSARGQRALKGGNPAACRSTMDAIDAYVKAKFRGASVPGLAKTFNALGKNLRVNDGYRSGKYRYITQKRKAAVLERVERGKDVEDVE